MVWVPAQRALALHPSSCHTSTPTAWAVARLPDCQLQPGLAMFLSVGTLTSDHRALLEGKATPLSTMKNSDVVNLQVTSVVHSHLSPA